MNLLVTITAILIQGEALTLLIGMGFLNTDGWGWLFNSPGILLLLDVLVGGYLLFLAYHGVTGGGVFWGSLILGLSSHLWRVAESWLDWEPKFCFNTPLMVLNVVKLTLLSLILVISIWERVGL